MTDPLVPRRSNGYGWHRDLPRLDKPMFGIGAPVRGLQASYDLRPGFDPAYDQLQTSSCVGNSTAKAFAFVRREQGLEPWTPSRSFIYYAARAVAGCQRQDNGAQIHDAFAQLVTRGAPPETDWPFDPAKINDWPPMHVWDAAKPHHALAHESVPQNITAMKLAFDRKIPVVFGFTVYESFESEQVARTGVMPVPGAGEKVISGHAVLAGGCDDGRQALLMCNSWGKGWGMDGWFWMPYSVAFDPNMASDFQLIRQVAA